MRIQFLPTHSIALLTQMILLFALSACTLDQAPGPQTKLESNLINFELISYSATSAVVNASGTLPAEYTTGQSSVVFHLSPSCTDTAAGTGVATQFLNPGIQIQIPISANPSSTAVYVSTNTVSGCLYLGQFAFAAQNPEPPTFLNTIPASPSRVSYTPAVLGAALVNSTVNLFSDSSCTTLVGTGTSQAFATTGIGVTLNASATTTIYGQTKDALNKKSNCVLLTSYKHSTYGPVSPIYNSIAPASPTNTSLTPTVFATASVDSVGVALYSDPGCSTVLATGSPSDLATNGFVIQVIANTLTTIYAKSIDADNNPSACTFLTNYLYDNVAPAAPTYATANPPNPTRLTTYPRISGFASSDTAVVKFYKTPLCLSPTGSGTKAEFEGAGILAGVDANSTTSLYFAAFDAAGNKSACSFVLNYRHNTIPPDPPVFGATSPVSPNNTSSTPKISGNASPTTVSIYFYSDDLCTNLLSSGSAANFNDDTVGILVPTPFALNAVNITSISTRASDPEGNLSDCSPLTVYGYSTAKAPAPSFLQSVPASPARTTNKPWILGTAPASVSLITLYSDSSCSAQVGSANRSVFATLGIQATLATNTSTNIYAISTDIYGNTSDCTFFTNYTHDDIPPLDPSFITSAPVSPTRLSGDPLIQGAISTIAAGKPLTTDRVKFYDSLLCLTVLGQGTPASFTNAGIMVSVPPNSTTSVYARASDPAGNTSNCVFMLNYTFSTNLPGKPSFTSSLPATPSYSAVSSVKGTIASSSDIVGPATVQFFRDAGCSSAIGSGSAATYKTSGIPVAFDKNLTTSVFAQVVDVVGSVSTCNYLFDFDHRDTGPLNLVATQNSDGSVLLNWNPDPWAFPIPKYIVKRSKKSGGPYSVISWQNAGAAFTDYSVTEAATYYYVVASSNSTGFTYNSSEASITVTSTSTQTPTSLIASPGPGIVTLQWTGASSNMFYKVMRSLTAGGPYTEIAANLNGTGYSDRNVVNDTSYYYVVIGTNPAGNSFYSSEANATPVDVPAPPTGLTAVMIPNSPACSGGNGVQLTWNAPSYFTDFVVGRNSSSGGEVDIAVTGSNSYLDCSAVTLPGNNPNRYYRVQANWGTTQLTLRSNPSNEVSVTSAVAPTPKVTPGNNEIYVKWIPNPVPNGVIVDYQVWKSSVAGWPSANYTLLNGNFAGTTYYDSAVTNNQPYYYVIVANYQNGPSWPSPEVGGVPTVNPGAPTNLIVQKDSSSNSPALAWSAPKYFNEFNIYRATAIGGPYTFIFANPTSAYIDTLTTPGTYYYKVTSTWGGFESAASNIVSYAYGSPATLTATATATNINLSYGAVATATSYQILRSTTSGGPYTVIASSATTTYSNTTTVPAAYPAVAGTGYFYVVQPVFPGSIYGQYSPEFGIKLVGTQTPSGLTVLSTTSGSVSLAWAKVSGATGYTVYKSTTLAGVYSSVGSSTLNSLTVNSLNPTTAYYFKVATTSCGTGCQSAAVLAYTYSVPAAPTINAGNNKNTVNWVGVIGATSYNILRSTDAVTFSNIKTGATGGTYDDLTATNGNIYFYKLQAIYPAGTLNSLASLAATPGVTPLVPIGVGIEDNSNGTDVTLGWTPVPGATTYNIYLSTTSGGPWGVPVVSSSSNTGNVVLGLTTGQKYYAVVSALNGSLESSNSAELAFIPEVQPAAPIVGISGNKMSVSWTAVSGAATYNLLRSVDLVNYTTIATGLAGTSYLDATILMDTSYSYYFVPKDATGVSLATSLPSSPVTYVLPPLLTGLRADVADANTANLTWAASISPQVNMYRIYRGSAAGGPYTMLSTIPSTTNQFQDSTLSANQTYYYVVSALNISGGESGYSNEAGVKTSIGAATLTATNVSNAVQLNWSTDVGASSYLIKRSQNMGGPYGIVTTVAAPATTYSDANVENGKTYFYVVDATLAGGTPKIHSPEVSIVAVKTINLQVPIELTDQPLSSDSIASTFERTRTSFDPLAYDGTVTTFIEIVAVNTDVSASRVDIVDSGAASKGAIVIPSGTLNPTRLRAAFNPNNFADEYRLLLAGTTNSDLLKIYSARILVNQVGATKTKLYFPLLASTQTPSLGDTFSPTESTSQTNYFSLSSTSIFQRNLTSFSQLEDYNPWEFEALVSSVGGLGLVGLYNQDVGDVVAASEGQFDSPNVQLVSSPFNEGVSNFQSPTNDGQKYQVGLKCIRDCDLGPVNVYKAGLWLKLKNISKAEILYRIGFSDNQEITRIDLSNFANPTVNFRTIASVPNSSTADVDLIAASTMTPVAGAQLNFSLSGLGILQTASPLSISSPEEYFPSMVTTGTPTVIKDASLVIDIHN